MTGWLLLGGAVLGSVAVSVAVMSAFVGYPFELRRSVRTDDALLTRVADRVRAGEDQHEALLDELRRPR